MPAAQLTPAAPPRATPAGEATDGALAALFDLDALGSAPLVPEPYATLTVPGFVRPRALAAINAAYPAITGPTAFGLEDLAYGDAFAAFVEALRSDALARRLAAKFDLDLPALPRTLSVRRFAEPSDGQIHADSRTKVVTVLVYLNPTWEQAGGRLRVLRSATDMEDYAAEIVPAGGTLFAFRRADHSWHGFPPCTGERRSIQMQYARPKRAERGPTHKHAWRKRLRRLRGLLPG